MDEPKPCEAYHCPRCNVVIGHVVPGDALLVVTPAASIRIVAGEVTCYQCGNVSPFYPALIGLNRLMARTSAAKAWGTAT